MMKLDKYLRKLTKIFRAFGNERRLKILKLLLEEGSSDVSEISEQINLSIKSTSKHLIQLDHLGLIKRERKYNHSFYEIESEVKKILNLFFKYF